LILAKNIPINGQTSIDHFFADQFRLLLGLASSLSIRISLWPECYPVISHMRKFTLADTILTQLDGAIRSIIVPEQRITARENPGHQHADATLSNQEKTHTAGLMRVNHSGEVCAQGLYQGQALTAKLHHVREKMNQAADEEIDHLAWCEQRLNELNSNPSILNPIWYSSSFILGLLAGMAGDKWSLGFVAETERQVTHHLENHIQQLSKKDLRTLAILNQMHEDESHHAQSAKDAGAAELPWVVKALMTSVSKLMTRTSYHF